MLEAQMLSLRPGGEVLPRPGEEFWSRFGDAIDDRVAEILDELLAERDAARRDRWLRRALGTVGLLLVLAAGILVCLVLPPGGLRAGGRPGG
jgi:hypothetical protein